MTKEAEYREKLGQSIRADKLTRRDRFFEPTHREIVAWLEVKPGVLALDAGCGAGGVTALLVEAVGERGGVAAVDIAPGLLETARSVIEKTPYAGRVTYHESDITDLPFADKQFELVWCSHVIHDLPDPLVGLRELRRVLKPGGRLAMREDVMRPRLLPFYLGVGIPGLEDRLHVAYSYRFAAFRRSLPGNVRHPAGWTQALRDAGFADVTARSFLLEALPPFTEAQRAYLRDYLRAPLDDPRMQVRVDPKDLQTLERLIDPEGPFYVLDRQDLHFIHVSTVYVGYV